MTQSTLVIDGSLGAVAARNAINTAYEALVTMSSGATPPAAKFANQLWYDTSTGIIKKRNNANDTWETLFAALGLGSAALMADSANADLTVDPDAALRRDIAKAYVDAQVAGIGWTSLPEVATTSGTAFDVTGIPAGVTEIRIMLTDVSLSNADNLMIQIGDSGGLEVTDYLGFSVRDGALNLPLTAGIPIALGASILSFSGVVQLFKMDGNKWVAAHVGTTFGVDRGVYGSARKVLSATLDRLRLTRTGSNTFSAGAFKVEYR